MRLLAHFLAADVRRFKGPIILWLTVEAVETGMQQAALLLPPGTPRAEAIAMAAWLLWLAGLLLSCALVPLLIQLHPAVGSEAFWMTRPIPPRVVAASKLGLLTVLFVGVPLAFEQVVMALHGMPAADMVRVAMQTALFRALLLSALTAAAVLTPNLGRFALLCGAALFGFAILPVVVMLVDAWRPAQPAYAFGLAVAGRNDAVIPFPAFDHTASLVAMAVLVAGGLACAVVQYRTRRMRDSLLVLAVAFAATFVAGSRWPVRALADGAALPEWAASHSTLELIADPAAARVERPPLWSAQQNWVARVPLRMVAAPPGWIATVRVASGELHVDGGARFSSHAATYPAALPDPEGRDPIESSLRHVLNVQRLWARGVPDVMREESGLVLHVPAEAVSHAEPRTGTFRGTVLIDLTEVASVAALPLQSGAGYQDGAYRITVDEVRETGGAVLLRTRVTGVTTMFDRRPPPMYTVFLRNPARAEALRGSGHFAGSARMPMFGAFSVFLAGPSGFSADAQIVTFQVEAPRDAAAAIDRRWLEQAELVVLRATHTSSVRRTLEIAHVPLVAARPGT